MIVVEGTLQNPCRGVGVMVDVFACRGAGLFLSNLQATRCCGRVSFIDQKHRHAEGFVGEFSEIYENEHIACLLVHPRVTASR